MQTQSPVSFSPLSEDMKMAQEENNPFGCDLRQEDFPLDIFAYSPAIQQPFDSLLEIQERCQTESYLVSNHHSRHNLSSPTSERGGGANTDVEATNNTESFLQMEDDSNFDLRSVVQQNSQSNPDFISEFEIEDQNF